MRRLTGLDATFLYMETPTNHMHVASTCIFDPTTVPGGYDFSKVKDDCRIKGFDVIGNWIHLKGLEVRGVPQNNNLNHESWGIWISGSDNVFELINAHNNMGPGLYCSPGTAIQGDGVFASGNSTLDITSACNVSACGAMTSTCGAQ